jgi:hypothetical protein
VTGFVNIHGQPVREIARATTPTERRPQRDSYHDGFAVVGIPPGKLEEAQRLHESLRRRAMHECRGLPPEWDAEAWIRTAKTRRVRTKPYELHSAAMQCAELAVKAGWLGVEVRELKKGDAV